MPKYIFKKSWMDKILKLLHMKPEEFLNWLDEAIDRKDPSPCYERPLGNDKILLDWGRNWDPIHIKTLVHRKYLLIPDGIIKEFPKSNIVDILKKFQSEPEYYAKVRKNYCLAYNIKGEVR